MADCASCIAKAEVAGHSVVDKGNNRRETFARRGRWVTRDGLFALQILARCKIIEYV